MINCCCQSCMLETTVWDTTGIGAQQFVTSQFLQIMLHSLAHMTLDWSMVVP